VDSAAENLHKSRLGLVATNVNVVTRPGDSLANFIGPSSFPWTSVPAPRDPLVPAKGAQDRGLSSGK
jgi:hypothetical protein